VSSARPSMARSPRDWDANTYHRVSDFQFGLGVEALERLALRGDETVLDAGCGTGRVTAVLAERLPLGRVIAVDGSPDMVAKARANLPSNCEVRVADLAGLELEEPVDAIVSTAVFHWIPDHDRLFSGLFAALRPGGRLVAQCGGRGNVARVTDALAEVRERPPFAEHLSGWEGPWHFPGPEETGQRLERAGFQDVGCGLMDAPMIPDDPAEYLRTVTLGLQLERLPPELHDRFVRAVLERLPDPPEIDYVRLNIDARRP
jgi:trans-aconitate 2-methyltransferase